MLDFGFPFGDPSWSFAKIPLPLSGNDSDIESVLDSAGVSAGAIVLLPRLRTVHPRLAESPAQTLARFVIGLPADESFVQFARFDHRQLAIHLMNLTRDVSGLHG